MKNSKFLCTVIGSQNTGKSTFIKDVINTYSKISLYEPFVTDECDYRKIIEEKKLNINREGNLESQRIIFDCLSQQVINSIRNPNFKNVIFDRSPIDALVYTIYLQQQGKVSEEAIDQMKYEVSKFVQLYDAIIYIPLSCCKDIKVVDDKFRDTDLEYRRYVDKLFSDVLNELDIDEDGKLIEIYGNRQERLEMFHENCNYEFIIKKDSFQV